MEEGSLRMGCLICPVITVKTLSTNIEKDLHLRGEIEMLRRARRITSPKTKNAGAIYIRDRRESWERIKQYLLEQTYITYLEFENEI